MPINYKKYPPNWRTEIVPRIKARDGHQCKFCGIENYTIKPNGTKVVLTIAHLDHDASTLMAQHCGKQALWVIARQGVGIGVTHPSVGDAHQHLAFVWRRNIDFYNLQNLFCPKSHCST